MNNKQFIEKQKFNQWWIWLILIFINLLLLFSIVNSVNEYYFPNFNIPDETGLITIIISILIVNYILFGLKLTTKINRDGIYIQFFPFHFKEKHFKWEDLSQCYIRKYNPISEYGGWGLRLGLMGKGKAYNVKGVMGLQLQFKNGKKLLIGTQKSEEIKQFLNSINQYNV